MRARRQVSPRKQPRQARAQATHDAILKAAAQVLSEEGYERTTTNRIADVAGVSIGSLYQYFPNKDAVVNALVERQENEMLQHLAEMASALVDAPLEEAVHTYVHAMLQIHAKEPRLRQVITQRLATLDPSTLMQMQARVESVVRVYLEKHRARLETTNIETAAFLLSTSVETIAHMAVIQRPAMLRDPAFADEVTALVLGYLLHDRRRGATRR